MTPTSNNLASLVDDMLQDAGCEQDAGLRGALLSLGTLGSLPAPPPTGELALLLAAGGPSPVQVPASAEQPLEQPAGDTAMHADGQPDDQLARRRRRHRPTALGLVLVAGMGLGVGGVAASSTAPGSTVQHLLEDWTPPWSSSPVQPSAAGLGYRAPALAADGQLNDAALPAAAGRAADAGNAASRLLRDSAGAGRHAGTRACAGPVKHGGGDGALTCTPADAGGALRASEAGGGRDDGGAAAAEGTPASAGGAGNAGTPASNGPAGSRDAAGAAAQAAAQKGAGAAANAEQGPGQGQSQGSGPQGTPQGNGQKTAPAK